MAISYTLLHPLADVPMTAETICPWNDENGRIGWVVRFADGHQVCLLTAEIEAMKRGAIEWRGALAANFFKETIR